jgi:hypothetical protein
MSKGVNERKQILELQINSFIVFGSDVKISLNFTFFTVRPFHPTSCRPDPEYDKLLTCRHSEERTSGIFLTKK